MISSEEALRRLAIGDPAYCGSLIATEGPARARSLDARSLAMLRLGGSIAGGAVGPVLSQRVAEALSVGVTFDEVVAALVVLASSLGLERTVAIAPEMAHALGYDIDADLERLDIMPLPDGAAPGEAPTPDEATTRAE